MRRYCAPTARISVSCGWTKISISCRAKTKTSADTIRQNTTVTPMALRMPLRMRSSFLAPKFCAAKVEKALPKSCTGI